MSFFCDQIVAELHVKEIPKDVVSFMSDLQNKDMLFVAMKNLYNYQ